MKTVLTKVGWTWGILWAMSGVPLAATGVIDSYWVFFPWLSFPVLLIVGMVLYFLYTVWFTDLVE